MGFESPQLDTNKKLDAMGVQESKEAFELRTSIGQGLNQGGLNPDQVEVPLGEAFSAQLPQDAPENPASTPLAQDFTASMLEPLIGPDGKPVVDEYRQPILVPKSPVTGGSPISGVERSLEIPVNETEAGVAEKEDKVSDLV